MAARHSRVYPQCLNLAGLDFDFFGVGVGCALKNLFLKPRLRGGVSQLLSLRLAAAELCNKMLFVGLRRRRRRRRNCKKTAEFALCHPSEIQSPGSNTAPIKKKNQKKKENPLSS